MNEPKPITKNLATELIRHIELWELDYTVIELNGNYYDITNADPQKVLELIKNPKNKKGLK